jgi:hypothetical protein
MKRFVDAEPSWPKRSRVSPQNPVSADAQHKLDEDKEIERYRDAANHGPASRRLVCDAPRTAAPG